MNSRSWARTALAAVVVFLILLAALHFIEPEFDPSKRLISEYELGRYGWVMSLAFFSLGIGVLAMLRSTGDAASDSEGAGSDAGGLWPSVSLSLGRGLFIPTRPPNLASYLHGLCGAIVIVTVPNCGNALQCCLGAQPGVDHLTGTDSDGQQCSFGWDYSRLRDRLSFWESSRSLWIAPIPI